MIINGWSRIQCPCHTASPAQKIYLTSSIAIHYAGIIGKGEFAAFDNICDSIALMTCAPESVEMIPKRGPFSSSSFALEWDTFRRGRRWVFRP